MEKEGSQGTGCNDVCVSGVQRGRGNQSRPHCCKAGTVTRRAGTTTTARAASHRSRPCCNTFFCPHASNSSRPTAVSATIFAGPLLSSFRPRFCGGPCLLLIPPAARRCARPAAPAPRPAQSRLARPEHAGPRGIAPSERLCLSAHVVIVGEVTVESECCGLFVVAHQAREAWQLTPSNQKTGSGRHTNQLALIKLAASKLRRVELLLRRAYRRCEDSDIQCGSGGVHVGLVRMHAFGAVGRHLARYYLGAYIPGHFLHLFLQAITAGVRQVQLLFQGVVLSL